MSTDVKVDTLAYALARARGFVVKAAKHPGLTEGFQDWAQSLLADIDRALEGTIYERAREEAP